MNINNKSNKEKKIIVNIERFKEKTQQAKDVLPRLEWTYVNNQRHNNNNRNNR